MASPQQNKEAPGCKDAHDKSTSKGWANPSSEAEISNQYSATQRNSPKTFVIETSNIKVELYYKNPSTTNPPNETRIQLPPEKSKQSKGKHEAPSLHLDDSDNKRFDGINDDVKNQMKSHGLPQKNSTSPLHGVTLQPPPASSVDSNSLPSKRRSKKYKPPPLPKYNLSDTNKKIKNPYDSTTSSSGSQRNQDKSNKNVEENFSELPSCKARVSRNQTVLSGSEMSSQLSNDSFRYDPGKIRDSQQYLHYNCYDQDPRDRLRYHEEHPILKDSPSRCYDDDDYDDNDYDNHDYIQNPRTRNCNHIFDDVSHTSRDYNSLGDPYQWMQQSNDSRETLRSPVESCTKSRNCLNKNENTYTIDGRRSHDQGDFKLSFKNENLFSKKKNHCNNYETMQYRESTYHEWSEEAQKQNYGIEGKIRRDRMHNLPCGCKIIMCDECNYPARYDLKYPLMRHFDCRHNSELPFRRKIPNEYLNQALTSHHALNVRAIHDDISDNNRVHNDFSFEKDEYDPWEDKSEVTENIFPPTDDEDISVAGTLPPIDDEALDYSVLFPNNKAWSEQEEKQKPGQSIWDEYEASHGDSTSGSEKKDNAKLKRQRVKNKKLNPGAKSEISKGVGFFLENNDEKRSDIPIPAVSDFSSETLNNSSNRTITTTTSTKTKALQKFENLLSSKNNDLETSEKVELYKILKFLQEQEIFELQNQLERNQSPIQMSTNEDLDSKLLISKTASTSQPAKPQNGRDFALLPSVDKVQTVPLPVTGNIKKRKDKKHEDKYLVVLAKGRENRK